jgi:hypothetical protein
LTIKAKERIHRCDVRQGQNKAGRETATKNMSIRILEKAEEIKGGITIPRHPDQIQDRNPSTPLAAISAFWWPDLAHPGCGLEKLI